MSTINVSILVDADLIVKDMASKTPNGNGEYNLGAWGSSSAYIYMVSTNAITQNDSQQAKSELTIHADSGDTIKWNMTTFGQNASITPVLYNSVFNTTGWGIPDANGNYPNDGTKPACAIEGERYANQEIGVRLPPSTDPLAPVQGYINNIYTFSADVNHVSQEVQYLLYFKLIDDHDGSEIGKFYWDPFIVIPF